ncbi:glycosyltransferase [Capilliphycus salinus ALCB114379]|uniref:glycosyltransferase n=1 Tax=Capilliphycus salinus TaxID=2768948 RepID=UPI0039A682C3
MKISVVVGDLSSSGAGRWGGAVRPFLLSQALQQLNLEVEMVGFVDNDREPAINQSIPIISVPKKHNIYPQFLISAQQLLRQITGEIIYAYKPKPTSWGLSLIKKMQTGRRVILDIDDWELSWHGGEQWKYHPTFKQLARDLLKPDGAFRQPDHPFYLKWMESLVSKADVITTHNQFLQKRFGGVYVPNGKDVNLFDPTKYDPQQSRSDYGLSDYRILMFPGAPRPYKGVEDVLMALDLLDQPDLRLVIVGGSPYDDYDNELTNKWGRWIIKIPKTPASEMPRIVAAAHIIVIPQRDSPAAMAQFPLKLTDGMAMAKPVLSTYVGDIPEILGDTGYLVEPNSPQQLADSIRQIFEHWEEADAKAIKAREKCVEKYSLEAMAVILSKVIAGLSV